MRNNPPVEHPIWLLLLAFGIYMISLHSPFFYDDLRQILWNPNIREGLGTALLSPERRGRLLMNFFFALNWKISSGASWSFHLANILVHLANGWLLARLLARLFPLQTALRWVSLALFLIHPLQAEAVTHVMSFPTLLEAFFTLSALLIRLREVQNQITAPWLLPFILLVAPFGKETGVLIPLTLLAFDFTLGKDSIRRPRWRSKLRYLPAFVAPLVWLLDSQQLASHQGVVGFHLFPMGEYLIVQLHSFLLRFWLIFTPANMSIFHEYPGLTRMIALTSTLGGIALLVLVGFLLPSRTRRRDPIFLFLGLFFLLSAAPYSSFLQFMNPFAEYRLYLSNIAVFVALAGMITWVLKWFPRHQTRTLLAILFLSGLTVLSTGEQSLWADPLLKVTQSVSNYPESWRLRLMLGEQFERREDFQGAEMAYVAGERLNREARPSERTLLPRMLIVQLLEKTGRFAQALEELDAPPISLLPEPRPLPYYQHLIYTLGALGQTKRRDQAFEMGLRYYPRAALLAPPFQPKTR